MNKIKTTFFALSTIVMLASCSTSKDRWLNRTYNSVTTKYNILYNGNLAFENGLNQIREKHIDDFWSPLSIEPITFEEKALTATSFNMGAGFSGSNAKEEKKTLTNFDLAEEKAVKAIQMHAMNIDGKERNNQIDDAYLLLGKSRYYTQRFIPAIEAFNYVIINYPYANLIDETKVWRAKTNSRLGNDKFAIETLKLVLNNKQLRLKIKEEAHTALAMAYVKTDSVQQAIQQLTLATNTQENPEQAARNLFVLGQLYSSENKKDSAAIVFQKLISFKKAPYKFKIHAEIDLAKATTKKVAISERITRFKELVKERENRPYLDVLYFHKGQLEQKRDSMHLAVEDFKISLRVPNVSKVQKTYAYEKLGDIAFSNSLFLEASAYYDSVIQISKTSTEKRIRSIKRKHKNLAVLTAFEKTLATNDSVLRIAALSDSAQVNFFKNHIVKLKEAAKKIAKEQLKNSSFGGSFSGGSSILSTQKGKWYFYNPQSLSFGKSEFEKVWGNRALADNWRISEKQQTQKNTGKDSLNMKATALKKYEIETYLETLPKSKSDLDSLVYHRNEALYGAGVIYKEQFKNIDLAIQRLERLLKEQPDKTLLLPAKYHLYQLYSSEKNPKSAVYKTAIISEYPTSKYAEILQNKPQLQNQNQINEIDIAYKELYYLYKEGEFKNVVSQIIELGPKIIDSNLIAKFELLKAMSIGKYQSKEMYKKALVYVSFNYGNTQEGQRAKEIIKQLN